MKLISKPSVVTGLILTSLITTPALASSGRPSAKPNPAEPKESCRDDWKMPAGKYKGQCIDTTRKLPVEIVEEKDGSITFRNFLYNNHWYTAKLPPQAAEQAIFQIDTFKTSIPLVVAAHTQIRFKLKEGSPIELTAQDPGTVPQHAQVRDLVFSDEYAAPKGIPYDILRGQLNRFTSVPRIAAMQDRASEQLKSGTETVRQYKLKVSPEQASRILERAIHRSNEMQFKTMYNTISDDCTTEAFDVIDQGTGAWNKIPRFRISVLNALDPIAGPSIKALGQRGLIDAQSEIQTLNDEYAVTPTCQ